MVGAGSVVTKDVQAHALVMGNPAKLSGYMCRCGVGLRQTHFADVRSGGSARYGCDSCGARYLWADSVMHDVEGPADAPAP